MGLGLMLGAVLGVVAEFFARHRGRGVRIGTPVLGLLATIAIGIATQLEMVISIGFGFVLGFGVSTARTAAEAARAYFGGPPQR
jgi:hypothetical protein